MCGSCLSQWKLMGFFNSQEKKSIDFDTVSTLFLTIYLFFSELWDMNLELQEKKLKMWVINSELGERRSQFWDDS